MMGIRISLFISILLTLGSKSRSQDSQENCRYLSLKCSYRGGCGATLRSYLLECNDLIKNKTEICSESCKYTLIGLTSTPEGKSMLDCDCGSDEECLNSRYRLEICSKDSVLYANRQDTVVSCAEAKWICMSDSECSKALEYYNIFCKSMFRGVKCTNRCRNSINILKKQNKASKLESCFCDNDEILGFKCSDIKKNMKELCLLDDEKESLTEKDNIITSVENEETTVGKIIEEDISISTVPNTEEEEGEDEDIFTNIIPDDESTELDEPNPSSSPPYKSSFCLNAISVIVLIYRNLNCL